MDEKGTKDETQQTSCQKLCKEEDNGAKCLKQWKKENTNIKFYILQIILQTWRNRLSQAKKKN